MIIAEDIILFKIIKHKLIKLINFFMNLRNLFTILLVALATFLSAQAVVRPDQVGRFDRVETPNLTLNRGIFKGKAVVINTANAKSYLIPTALAVYNAINARLGNGTYTLPIANPDTTTGVRSVAIFTGSGAGTDTATFVNAVDLTTREKVTIVTDTVNATVGVGVTAYKFATTQVDYTATLPANPTSGDVVYLMFETGATALTVSGGSKTIRGSAATSGAQGVVVSYQYIGGVIDKWFRRD